MRIGYYFRCVWIVEVHELSLLGHLRNGVKEHRVCYVSFNAANNVHDDLLFRIIVTWLQVEL